jgi:hypothetical protein
VLVLRLAKEKPNSPELQRDHLDLDRDVLTVDPDTGALHESASRLWLGPPKTPASARTISLPPFLITLLRDYIEAAPGSFAFTSPLDCRLRRSTFDRRVFRPAVDGDVRHGLNPVRPRLTFHGLRHSHKTWLIADDIPEIAQAKRLLARTVDPHPVLHGIAAGGAVFMSVNCHLRGDPSPCPVLPRLPAAPASAPVRRRRS